ncbi:hypothetical protein J4464_00085 [Candidatus Woesearchaeota archaeon]|nr:hypothetical protein [Candidatus Woesearchaeota archaeon]
MGLVAAITGVWHARSLRRECLDEILNAAAQAGITLTTVNIDHTKVYRYGTVNNSARMALEAVRRTGVPYTLEFFVQEQKEMRYSPQPIDPLPEGYIPIPIGKAINTNYERRKAEFSEQLKTYIKGLIGTYYVPINLILESPRETWTPEVAEATGIPIDTLPLGTKLRDFSSIKVNGPDDPSWVREQPWYTKTMDAHARLVEKYKDIQGSQSCPQCDGSGNPQTWGQDYGKCDYCDGHGSVDADAYRAWITPSVPEFTCYTTDRLESVNITGITGDWASILRIEEAGAINPCKESLVYMKIVKN